MTFGKEVQFNETVRRLGETAIKVFSMPFCTDNNFKRKDHMNSIFDHRGGKFDIHEFYCTPHPSCAITNKVMR